MALNLVQWDSVFPYYTGMGPLGANLVLFRVILGPRARGWGLFRAYFSPVWLPQMTWMTPNVVQWGRVLPYCTGGALWGIWGPFGGHFSPFWSDFGHTSKRLGHILSIFLTHLAFKNDFHAHKYCTLGQGITILYWWGPLGAILGHFRVILGPRARSWGLFGAYFSTVWLPKWLEGS